MLNRNGFIMNNESILCTWKCIATFMGMSVSTLKKKYERSKRSQDRMPIIHDGAVKAIPEDLRNWLRRQGNYSLKSDNFKSKP